jgi:filamentous hemagglutinin
VSGRVEYLFNSLAHPQNTYEAGVRQAILRGDVAELQALLGNGTLSAQDALIAQRALAAMQSVGAENSAMLAGRYGVDWVNKVGHIFEGVHQGPVGQALLGKFGSPIEAMAQVQRALEVAKPSTGLFSNTFQTTVNVQGVAVQVRGAVVDGVYRIGTILKW